MTDRITLFADVILPVPIYQEFTYRIPFELNEQIFLGQRVIVPFGKNKRITGIVTKIHSEIPQSYQSKYIDLILDDKAIVLPKQLEFWKWIASYYMAPIGDVMNAALPANFKLASETKIVVHPDCDTKYHELNEKEILVMEVLSQRESTNIKELSDILEVKNIHAIINKLIQKGWVITQEEINQRYIPKTKRFVQINQNISDKEIGEHIDELEANSKSQKQYKALLQIVQFAQELGSLWAPIEKSKVTALDISESTISTLEKKGLIHCPKLQIDRILNDNHSSLQAPILSDAQKTALLEIENSFLQKAVTLLQGVTGSGKTEIYIQLIQAYLDKGQQVLFLLPEIALTTQLIQRLEKYFGRYIGVYHSRFNQNERVEIWNKVLENDPSQFRLIVGARSAIFLPFQNLGLIIVDEEHEGSFKQFDPSPRYNARDAAIFLAHMQGAKVLLGSATPSLETYHNAITNRYGKVILTQRYNNIAMPEIELVDTKLETKKKTMHSHFTSALIEHIKTTLDNKEQVILFQNRRGYTPLWSCEICQWIPKCDHCDVSLTYHKHSNLLKCHYCGFTTPPMGSCKACGSHRLKMLGFGTEKIEDEIKLFLPDARVARMDSDTTRSKHAYSEMLEKFESRQIDILIGTQMLSKGLDFDHVTLVGVLDADMLLNRPDFRAYERGFQLMTQVSGRPGRKKKQGLVVIQTGQPKHWILELVRSHNVDDFLKYEYLERENFKYPPFYKMIVFTFRHVDENLLNWAAKEFTDLLRAQFKERVLGPEFPIYKKIQNQYLKETKLKYEKTISDQKVKEHVSALLNKFYENTTFKGVRIVIDVDPY